MIGIYVGMGSSRVNAAALLTSELVLANGSNMSILGIGEDVVFDSSTEASSWPLRVGGTLTNSTANRFGRGISNGRVAINTASTAAKTLGKATGLYKSLWVVAESPAQPFATYYQAVEARANPSAVMICNNGGTGWYTAGVSRSFYRDGSVTTSISASGLHIYESLFTGAEQASGVDFAGDVALARAWTAPLCAVLAFAAAPSAQQRADTVTALRKYYRI